MPQPQRILIIPAYNEAKTIIPILERAYPHVDRLMVVDDGSTDDSRALVRAWGVAHPNLVLLSLRKNQGMSGALLVGFFYVMQLVQTGHVALSDVVVMIDADGQHRPEEIPDALAALALRNSDVLLGRRDLSGYPWFKQIGNWGLSWWATLLSGRRYHDVECGFRLMRVEVLVDMLPYFIGRRYGCAQEIGIITARRGWKIDNTFPTHVSYYRPGARVRDGVTNLTMGFLAFCRVLFRMGWPTEKRVDAVLEQVTFRAGA